MAVILDILSSIVIGGFIILMSFGILDSTNKFLYSHNDDLIVQQNLTAITTTLEYDLKKIGFGIPVGTWMRNGSPMAKLLDSLMDVRRNLPGIVPNRLTKIVNEHRAATANHEDILWPLVNYVLWRQAYLDGEKNYS